MNLRSPIFRKLLLSALVVILAALGAFDFYLARYVGARELQNVEQRLAAQARAVAPELASIAPNALPAWARQIAAASSARVTIIDRAGAVLADSSQPAGQMEDHRSRPELEAALAGQAGRAIRHSDSLDVDFYYVAVPARVNSRPGYALRFAVPLRDVDDAIAALRERIFLASALAALLAMAAAYAFSRGLSTRIRRLQTFAQDLSEAKYIEPLPPGANDELGDLAQSLSGMARRLHQTMDKLTLESARRDAILASMVEGVLAVDNELCVTFCNESFARAVGAAYPVPEKLPLNEFVSEPRLIEMLSRVLVTGQTRRELVQIAPASGRTYEAHVAPLAVRSRRGAIAVLHDITDIERLERVRKDFVANVSHELRTPLAAIRGYAETLLEGALEDKENNRRFLEIIRAQAVRLNSIASDLLILSELESADPQSAPTRISVQAAVDAALFTLQPEASVRNVALCPGPVVRAFVMGNPIRLEQALTNLLNNAVKFNHPGGEVRVSAVRTDGRVQISVSDTGIGIPAKDLPRIFERFYRVDKARSREVGGTGLGLSIVKHVLERMGGAISVESRLGEGSTFTVTLPAVD